MKRLAHRLFTGPIHFRLATFDCQSDRSPNSRKLEGAAGEGSLKSDGGEVVSTMNTRRAAQVVLVLAALVAAAGAQWLPDLRLTYSDSASHTSYSDAWCVAAAGDTVHAVFYEPRSGAYQAFYKRSTDAGLTWSGDTALNTTTWAAEYPSVAASGDTVHAAWEDYRDGNFEIYYRRSLDAGATWEPELRLTSSNMQSWYPAIAAAGPLVHVVWEDGRNGYYESFDKYSTDGGATWSADFRLAQAPPAAYCQSVAIAGSTVYAVWSTNFANVYTIRLRRSTSGGAAWDSVVTLTQTADFGCSSPSVAACDSLAYVVWADDRYANTELVYKVSADAGATWGADLRLTNDAASSYSPSVAARDSLVHVVWQDNRAGNWDILYKCSTDRGVSWGADTGLTTDPGLSQQASIANTRQGLGVVWQDYRDGNWEVYYKGFHSVPTGLAGSGAGNRPPFCVVPNPFAGAAVVTGREREEFRLVDAIGRGAGTFTGNRIGYGLTAGVYFVTDRTGAAPVRVVKLR
jgi:hypothetical protein